MVVVELPEAGVERGEIDDAAIADALGISRNAALKMWRGTYERVDRRLPQLVPKGRATDGSRGQEKRRHVLLYLRGHLEELRPSRRKNDETGVAAKAQRRPSDVAILDGLTGS